MASLAYLVGEGICLTISFRDILSTANISTPYCGVAPPNESRRLKPATFFYYERRSLDLNWVNIWVAPPIIFNHQDIVLISMYW